MTHTTSCKNLKGEVHFDHPTRCGCSTHVLTPSERERRSEATARVVHQLPNGCFSYDCPNGYTCPDEGVCRCVETRKKLDEIHAERKRLDDLTPKPLFKGDLDAKIEWIKAVKKAYDSGHPEPALDQAGEIVDLCLELLHEIRRRGEADFAETVRVAAGLSYRPKF